MDFNKFTNILQNLGLESVYFCTGARNASLLSPLKKFNLYFSIDERSAAFSALGEAKLTGKPCAICTTSGTAVAECLPAFIEAYFSGVKLVLLSADRPKRLHDTWAPQTINQKEVMGDYARGFFSGDLEQFSYIGHTLKNFPLHINIEIDDTAINFKQGRASGTCANKISQWVREKNSTLFVFSEGACEYQDMLSLVDELGYPSYVECLSLLNSKNAEHLVRYDLDVQSMIRSGVIDSIVLIGRTPIAKFWRLLEKEKNSIDVLSIISKKFGLSYGEFLSSFSMTDLESLSKHSITLESRRTRVKLESLLVKYPQSEASLVNQICDQMTKNSIIYVGNSMPIRYWQLLSDNQFKVYANRGANGIDGQISTAIGMARSTKEQVYCIVGDLTLLYDIGAFTERLPLNLEVICINNKGGRIFDRVDVDKDLILEHSKDIKALTSMFPSAGQVREIIPSNDQTDKFWNEWICL